MGIKDLIKMNDEQPTPETDAAIDDSPYYQSRFVMVAADLARKLERERDKAQERAESKHGLWMAELSRVTELEKQLETMREAIREVYRVLDNALFVHQAITTYASQDAVDKIENQKHCDNMKTALAKLQPFIK